MHFKTNKMVTDLALTCLQTCYVELHGGLYMCLDRGIRFRLNSVVETVRKLFDIGGIYRATLPALNISCQSPKSLLFTGLQN